MDPSDFPISRSPRKELQGPRPPALKVHKDSYKIKKPPVAPQQQQQQQLQQQTQPRAPVIIYTVSPKVIHTNPSDFMSLVQRLTGSSSSSVSDDHCNDAISPAARYATIAKAIKSSSPKEKKLKQPRQRQISGDHEVGFVEEIETDKVLEKSSLFPGILSPGPASLPPIPPNYFSPLPYDANPLSSSSISFFHDFSPAVVHGNRNIFEGSFMPSPSTYVSLSPHIPSPTPSIDLFNNFNNFFDF